MERSLPTSAASAVRASPIVLVCVEDYKVTRSILGTKEVAPALAGRALVELSSGTPQDARDAEAWARARGIDYLDGAIMATPSQMGGRTRPFSYRVRKPYSGGLSRFSRPSPEI